jgi:hypothetical protein
MNYEERKEANRKQKGRDAYNTGANNKSTRISVSLEYER